MINQELINQWVGQSESQWKMRSRLINAYSKVDELDKEEFHQIIDFLRIFAMLGMKVAMNDAFNLETPKIEFDKLRLELDYQGHGRPSLSDFDKIETRMDEILHRRDRYNQKLKAIQIHYGVTGLEAHPCELGDKTIIHPTDHWENELTLIPSDLEVLRQWKPKMIDFWKKFVVEHELKIYRHQERSQLSSDTINKALHNIFHHCNDHPYIESSFEEIDAIAALSDWADPWDRKQDGAVSLDLGTGIDLQISGVRIEFVAIPKHKKAAKH